MLLTLAAMTIGAATFKKALKEGGVDKVGWELERLKQAGLSLAQSQSGEAPELVLTHNIGKIQSRRHRASEKENAP
jgi:hypothetical protein